MTTSFEHLQQTARAEWDRLLTGDTPVVLVGTATCGRSAGALDTLSTLRDEMAGHGLACRFVEVGCLGPCYAEPLVTVHRPGEASVCFASVDKQGARRIAAWLAGGDLPTKLAFATMGPAHIPDVPDLMDTPMMKGQVRRILRNCGVVDPTNIHHSLARGAYTGLQRALELGRDASIARARAVGAARSRRCGLPGVAQVEVLHRGPGRHEVHRLQRGRGRPGRVHEPLVARRRSARRARGHAHRGSHHRRGRGVHLLPRGVPPGAGAARRGHRPGRGGGLPRSRRPGSRASLPHPREGGCGRVRLRRGDGADRVPGGSARHAAAASALPRGERALGAPHGHQQRGDARLRGAHLPARSRLVRRVRHREEQGHQDVRPGRQRAAAGAGRGAAGHDAAADDLRDRRRSHRRSTGSRPSRPAVPPAAACPRTSSTSRWTTSRSRRRERSWGPAASW